MTYETLLENYGTFVHTKTRAESGSPLIRTRAGSGSPRFTISALINPTNEHETCLVCTQGRVRPKESLRWQKTASMLVLA